MRRSREAFHWRSLVQEAQVAETVVEVVEEAVEVVVLEQQVPTAEAPVLEWLKRRHAGLSRG